MTEITRKTYTDERSLFHSADLKISQTVFEKGESPLKECHNIDISESLFRYKYPFWYTSDVKADRCTWFDMARAGVWYCSNVEVSNSLIEAPKNFRRCSNLSLKNVTFTNAAETLWHCSNVDLKDVTVKGDYFAMNCSDMTIEGLVLDGNYSFDGVKNLTIRNSHLISKDAFWNSENVTVENCFITGEYIGWNAKNLTFINCTIESLQGLCYIDNLVMRDCHLFNTNLAFEFSNVDAEVTGDVISILNPGSGIIKAEHIGELVVEKDKVDPSATKIICSAIDRTTDFADYSQLM